MSEIYNIQLHKEIGIPLYQQLGNCLYELIEKGTLKPNTKLPPIRTMAKALKVNNITVVNAYKYLESKHVVYSQMGSGTYVSDISVQTEAVFLPEKITRPQKKSYSGINFANSSAPSELFPVDEFQIFLNEVLQRDKGEAFSYQDSQGYFPLREAVAAYAGTYGIKTSAEKIQIINGAQQGIDLISKALITYGDTLIVEEPTYYGAIGAFFSRGAKIIQIPLNNDGLDMRKLEEALKMYKPRFIYTMPYFQTPTCISYSIGMKRKLLELAEQYGTYIIEEDNLSDFNYNKDNPIVPLKALDYKNRVIYIKSFSKIIMPGIRLGFMILPLPILNKVKEMKYTTDISSSGFIQRTLDLYLKSDLWNKHLEKINSIFYERYTAMTNALKKHLGSEAQYSMPMGGLSFWIKIEGINIDTLCNNLLSQNVTVTPGAVFYLSEYKAPYIRISFSSVSAEEIERGVSILGREIRRLLLKLL